MSLDWEKYTDLVEQGFTDFKVNEIRKVKHPILMNVLLWLKRKFKK